MTKKLYLVKCRGMQSAIGCDVVHGVAYVVAENSEEAYRKLRDSLDKRDLGFAPQREMETVELLAEQKDYPNCRHALYL